MGGANGWATGDLGRVEAAVGRLLVRGKVVGGKLRAIVVPAGQRRDSRLNMVICPPTQPGVGTSTHARGGSCVVSMAAAEGTFLTRRDLLCEKWIVRIRAKLLRAGP